MHRFGALYFVTIARLNHLNDPQINMTGLNKMHMLIFKEWCPPSPQNDYIYHNYANKTRGNNQKRSNVFALGRNLLQYY